MALKLIFLLLMVCSCIMCFLTGPISRSGECLQSVPGIECQCKAVNQTIHVHCFCLPVKTVDLRNLSQEYEVIQASVFTLQNCRSTSVLVFPGTFSDLNSLEYISFYNVGRLTLEHNCINLRSISENVILNFSLITNLSIRKNAINIQPRNKCMDSKASINIKHSTLLSLMKSAIVTNLKELTMEEMILKARPWPEAIVVLGSAGASVSLKSVSIKKGLTGRWITGNISRLSITESNLRLLPEAFAGVTIVEDQESNTGITLFGNNFMIPSLPSQALPSDAPVLQAQKNRIVCQCQNLAWLLEPPNTPLKNSVKDSLICRNKSLDLLLPSCETHFPSTV
ncbi:uncharacterized protein LOC123510076 [Portunus trituberculatus]|uniref:uncharacterized protein LOC123510076 n=1 Tax=Portunus trituberculatus TaxID=210409 RepID=UPI001E1D219B|nr:uncharacterized protein LOC123510076 [Portunus trituberculatus]